MVLSLNRWIVTDGGLTVKPGTGPWRDRVVGSYCSIAYWDGNTAQTVEKLPTSWISQTNNGSEYRALIYAVSKVARFEYDKNGQPQKGLWKDVYIFMDSKLVVNQVNGLWKCNSQNLMTYNKITKRVKQDLGFTLMWVPRGVVFEILGH